MDGSVPTQARPANQQLQNLIRPEQVAKLPHLNPQQKQQTEMRVQKFWEYIHANSNNPSDPNYVRASQQLAQLSSTLMQGMKQFNFNRQRERQAAAQAAQAGQTNPQPVQNQPQPQNQPNGTAQPQQANSAITFSQLLPEVQARVNSQTFYYPPAMSEGSRPAEQWLQEAKARYGQAIQRAQMAKSKKAELQRAAQARQQSGNPLSQDEQNGLQAKLNQCDKAIRESQNFMEKFKEQQEQFRNARPQQRFSQSGGAPGQIIPPDASEGRPNQGPAPQQMQQNVQGPQAHSIATAQAAARATAANATATGGNVGNASQPTSATMPPGSQQTPIDKAAAQAGFNSQSAIMTQPTQSRPSTATGPGSQGSIHPSISSNMQASHAHPSSAVSAHPLNAVNGMKAHPPPIPKNLQVADPTPVQMPPSRPTLNGGANVGLPGQLAQPALTTFPGYVLEQSEDGHLLSKKKLHDLVREVVGPNSDDQLTPEAEEICLNLLDDFVEDLITSGCRLAKLRGATSLEARDCMVVLERQYNMRIPGFSTDEVRTVRKSQPAAGWAHKVSAVQAAKLMNGTGASTAIGGGAATTGAANGGG